MHLKNPWKEFLSLSLSCQNKEELSELFVLLLTYEERQMISSRMAIIDQLLEAKISQRTMAEKLHVSISQITRGSNALKMVSKKLKEKLSSHFSQRHTQ